jgi:TctA family transporter
MDLPSLLALGFHTAFGVQNLACCLAGALLGTLIGMTPGLGPVMTIALVLPATQGLDATPALMLLAGIYYGAQYGGSTASILINVPGEQSAAVTAIDGHQLARQGRAGVALAVAALGSFFAGCVGTAILAALAVPLVELAFHFGPAEYFALVVLGLVGAVVLASGPLVKALGMIVLGVLLGQVHADAWGGVSGRAADAAELAHGISFVAVAMGLFGFGDIVARLGRREEPRAVAGEEVQGPWPSRQDLKEAWPAVLRGTALGSLLGVLPGGGALLASFASYALEQKAATPRVPFGRGAIQGVAGPESANNAGAQTSFIPTLLLGIPPNAVMALIVGAMTLKDVPPGPQVMASSPALFWGLIASMWLGNLALLVFNLPLVGLWIRVLRVPYRLLFPVAVALGCVGLYTLNHNPSDVFVAALFTLLSYAFHKLGCEPAPLLLGFILGPTLEDKLRQTLVVSGGDWGTFLKRPLSAGLLAAALVVIVVVMAPSIRSKREEVFQED